MNNVNGVAVVILTHNEEIHIARAIQSVSDFANEIFIVDSHSTDRTCEIARDLGAYVICNKFINYASQFQWALDNCSITSKWIMRLDADEIIEKDLAKEILEKLPTLASDVVGVNLKRKHIFMDRFVRHGGRYPLLLLRIWRNGMGRIENRWMDEHMVVWGGVTVTFSGGFSDHNLNDLSFFINKHNKYATREAIDVLNHRLNLFPRDEALSSKNTALQASLKRFFKEYFYNKLPFTVASFLYFVWRYIFQLGFLDGRSGLVYHFLQGYWYRFLVGAKIMELERAISSLKSKDEVLRELSRLTGHDLKR
ncbi:glycosyltransferase family 2 protein [Comamonadaceae bacterium PP-2]